MAIHPSLRDWALFLNRPRVEAPGYFHKSLRDRPLRNTRKTLGLSRFASGNDAHFVTVPCRTPSARRT